MFTQTEVSVLLNFLDRVPLTGHQERNAMNVLCHKIGNSLQPIKDVVEKTNNEDSVKSNKETAGDGSIKAVS